MSEPHRPFIPLYQGARSSLVYNLLNTPYLFVNTVHFHTDLGFDNAALTLLNNTLIAWDASYYSDCRHGDMLLITVHSIALDSPTAPQLITNLETPQGGTYAGAIPAFTLTKSCHFISNNRGRGQQGHANAPPLPQYAMADPKTVTLGFAHTLADSWDALRLLLPLLSTPMQLIVASYRANKNWREVATYVPVTGCVVENTRVNTLRRRIRQVAV